MSMATESRYGVEALEDGTVRLLDREYPGGVLGVVADEEEHAAGVMEGCNQHPDHAVASINAYTLGLWAEGRFVPVMPR